MTACRYNAHSTGVNALWASVPILSLPDQVFGFLQSDLIFAGSLTVSFQTMGSRVGASLLKVLALTLVIDRFTVA